MPQSPNQNSGQEFTKRNLHHFREDIREILQPGNPEFTSLMSYIQRLLVQFHLTSRHSPEEIFNTAYCRSIKAIEEGNSIRVPLAWMRRTSLNIIRELSRASKKSDSLDEEGAAEPSCEDSFLDGEILREDIKLLYLALEQLNEVDRQLLELRYLQGYSWQEVGQCLAIANPGKQTEATLRQRGHRALKRLRDLYMELASEGQSDTGSPDII